MLCTVISFPSCNDNVKQLCCLICAVTLRLLCCACCHCYYNKSTHVSKLQIDLSLSLDVGHLFGWRVCLRGHLFLCSSLCLWIWSTAHTAVSHVCCQSVLPLSCIVPGLPNVKGSEWSRLRQQKTLPPPRSAKFIVANPPPVSKIYHAVGDLKDQGRNLIFVQPFLLDMSPHCILKTKESFNVINLPLINYEAQKDIRLLVFKLGYISQHIHEQNGDREI